MTINDPSTITHLFIKGKNIDTYSLTVVTGKGSGRGVTGQVIPSNQTVNGFQHDLRSIGPLSTSEVELIITGTSPQLYELMLLESLLELDVNFTEIRPTRLSRGSTVRQNIKGQTFRVGSLADRSKWQTQFEALFLPTSNTNGDDFIRALEDDDNFAFAEDFERFPDRVYPCHLYSEIDIEYIGRRYNQRRIAFTLAEA